MSIVFSEGPMPLNWVAVLSQIREDVEGFITEGGWSFLHDSMGGTDEAAADGSGDSDSDFGEKDIDEDSAAASDDDESFSDDGGSDARSSSMSS